MAIKACEFAVVSELVNRYLSCVVSSFSRGRLPSPLSQLRGIIITLWTNFVLYCSLVLWSSPPSLTSRTVVHSSSSEDARSRGSQCLRVTHNPAWWRAGVTTRAAVLSCRSFVLVYTSCFAVRVLFQYLGIVVHSTRLFLCSVYIVCMCIVLLVLQVSCERGI